MNSLIEDVKKMSISHKTLFNRISSLIVNIEKKEVANLEENIEETTETKVDTVMDNIFENDDNFVKNVRKAIKPPLESDEIKTESRSDHKNPRTQQ